MTNFDYQIEGTLKASRLSMFELEKHLKRHS